MGVDCFFSLARHILLDTYAGMYKSGNTVLTCVVVHGGGVSKPGGENVTEPGVEPMSSGCLTGDRTTDLKRSAVVSGTGIHRLMYRNICVAATAHNREGRVWLAAHCLGMLLLDTYACMYNSGLPSTVFTGVVVHGGEGVFVGVWGVVLVVCVCVGVGGVVLCRCVRVCVTCCCGRRGGDGCGLPSTASTRFVGYVCMHV